MSAKHGETGMPGSVPNVKRAAQAQRLGQAKLNAEVKRRRQGSEGTKLAALVKRSIK